MMERFNLPHVQCVESLEFEVISVQQMIIGKRQGLRWSVENTQSYIIKKSQSYLL